jgi:predicted dehydrogenase
MTKPVRWGVLGAANFAKEYMAPAIHAAKGAELYALATSDAGKAKEFSAFCPTLKVHKDYDALLADPEVEAVYIPLPNHLHVDWTLKALQAGKHVLCEKPMALEAADIDRVIAARDASGLLAAEAYMIVHHPQWQRARDWVQAGEIGAVLHADAQFTFRLLDMDNIRNRPDSGGGSLRDIGVYTFGSMRFVTGAEVETLEARIRWENDIDAHAHVFGTLASAKDGAFTFSSTTSMRLYNRQVVTIQGETGMIRLEGGPYNANVNDLAQVELHTQNNRVVTERFPGVNHYILQVEAFGRSIRDGVAYPCPLEFVRGTQVMIDRAYESAVAI